jgi:hypothetical protein
VWAFMPFGAFAHRAWTTPPLSLAPLVWAVRASRAESTAVVVTRRGKNTSLPSPPCGGARFPTLTPLGTLTPSGIGPPIVRQWRRRVWVIVRWQTTGSDNLADHNGVITSVVHAIGCALEPGERAIDEWCTAERAWGVRNTVKLAEQVTSAI